MLAVRVERLNSLMWSVPNMAQFEIAQNGTIWPNMAQSHWFGGLCRWRSTGFVDCAAGGALVGQAVP